MGSTPSRQSNFACDFWGKRAESHRSVPGEVNDRGDECHQLSKAKKTHMLMINKHEVNWGPRTVTSCLHKHDVDDKPRQSHVRINKQVQQRQDGHSLFVHRSWRHIAMQDIGAFTQLQTTTESSQGLAFRQTIISGVIVAVALS